MSLAELIRTRRNALGLSQTEVAARADLGQRSISEIETGLRKRPTYRVLRQIGHVLDIPMKDMLLAAGFAESEEEAQSLVEEVKANEDPVMTAIFLDLNELDESTRELVQGIVRSLRKNQEAIEKKFKGE